MNHGHPADRWRMKPPPLPERLRFGRTLIVRRALFHGVVRGVTFALLSGSALWLAAGLTQLSTGWSPAGTPLLAGWVAVILLGGSLIVTRAKRRASRRWPEVWDRVSALPQTVATCVDVSRRGNPSPWAPLLLERAAHLPLPTPASLGREFPSQRSVLLGASILALSMVGVAVAIPQRTASIGSPVEPALARTRLAETLVGVTGDATVRERLTEAARRLAAGEEATAHLIAAHERLRALEAEIRHRATVVDGVARRLALLPGTRSLAQALRGEAHPDGRPNPPLTAAERRALDRGARELETVGLDEWADALRQFDPAKAPEVDLETPAPVSAAERWRAVRMALVLIRAALNPEAASAWDPELRGGGLERSWGASPDAERDEHEYDDHGGDSTAALRLAGAVRSQPGEEIAAMLLRYLQSSVDPAWERILARPEIEEEWIPVAERYRALRRAHEERPRE